MTFERFTNTGRGYIPKASLWRRGHIGLNQGAVQRFGLSNNTYAILFYDRETHSIGLKFTNDEREVGIIRLVMGKTGVMIAAKSFLDYHAIDYTTTRKHDIVYNQENDLHVIQIDTQDAGSRSCI